MKRIYFILLAIALMAGACNSNQVKVRGKITGLEGKVKLLAELPGQAEKVVLAEEDVKDGSINLATEQLAIPGRVWVDVAGKRTLEFIVDTKDQIWIQGKDQFPEQIEVKGSGLEIEYDKIRQIFKEKYEGPLEAINRSLQKIYDKEKATKDDQVMLTVYLNQKSRNIRNRANYAKTLVEANPGRELSLFIMKDELGDDIELQKELFQKLTIENKESNIYTVMASKLQ